MTQAVRWCVTLDQHAIGGLKALREGGTWGRFNNWTVEDGRGGLTDVFARAWHLLAGIENVARMLCLES